VKYETVVTFIVLLDYFLVAKKKDQHFNRKKTRENHLSEGK
jgi:hypothetical protein